MIKFNKMESCTLTPVQSHSYTYGNAGWKDQLTQYDGAAVSYDSTGNPTGDGTWTYTWEHGKQLQGMGKTGETLIFEYNEDGLRVKKTATSTGTTVYTLHGKNIVHMTQGSHALHFYYDAQGKPAVVIYDGTAYGYLYNLQGDVVALVNGAGTKVVEYTYDAWGVQLTRTGTMANSLGKIQPFRYRGYVYDEETELYYLRNRYYRPGWGRFVSADVLMPQSSSLYEYCRCCPSRFYDKDGQIEADAYAITQEYHDYLQAVYDYSIMYADDSSVISVDEFDAHILDFAKHGYSYEEFACAYSIAKCLEPAKSATGMTSMQEDYAVATISVEAAGGRGPHLLDYSILAMYDSSRKPPQKPWYHGGILISYPTIYESCSSHGFDKGDFSDQDKAGGWTHLFWHKGVKLSGKLLRQVEAILYTVIDDEE